ncbi:Uu.00g036380.m01.CDS01 [Anthostomella pinea]|uniref:Uu.00g036380.m01.CDS01 n=1 Tax=Anthostomella pinea TaxID=933095 RepID=A0AAI8VAE3_9PEZI|nr:Uu.00g036380.m01.CDS01 [Anthostomella pinea]
MTTSTSSTTSTTGHATFAFTPPGSNPTATASTTDGGGSMSGMSGMGDTASMGTTVMDTGSCKISMLWNWETIDACFLSESWRIRSAGAFAALCIGVILLVMLLELLRRTSKHYDRYIIRQHEKSAALASATSQGLAETPKGSLIAKSHDAVLPAAGYRPNIWQQATRALLHTLQFALGYWIMLLAMYYNGYIIICIIIGAFIGSFIFQWERIGATAKPAAAQLKKRRAAVVDSDVPPGWDADGVDGCWTCRLRRKKCDETKPICSTCGALEITCHFDDGKPAWLDGGAREKRMADEIKIMVKGKANHRRDRKSARVGADAGHVESGRHGQLQRHSSPDGDGGLPRNLAPVPAPSHSRDGNLDSSTSDVTSEGTSALPPLSTSASSASSPTGPETTGIETAPLADTGTFPGDKSESEAGSIMVYLDYVVPFLSPFYRPCLLESSRGWMLVLLMKNRTLFHTALSLATYFYSVVLDAAGGNHGACKQANWTELQSQQELSIKALQRELSDLNARGVGSAFQQSVYCLQSIIQLLEFEVAIANTQNCRVHLDAAVVLFDQLIASHATDCGNPWHSVLGQMGLGNLAVSFGTGRHPWSSDQSAYRFYTAHLLWIDIIAATAGGEAPRLQKYHAELLHGERPPIRLEDFIGCHNWAMVQIAEIAGLAAWKKDRKDHASLSLVELVRRADLIESSLRQGLSNLDITSIVNPQSVFDPSAQAPHLPFSGLGIEVLADAAMRTTPALALHTSIWAQAALTYLCVVVSGPQTGLPEIRESIRATMDLIRLLPSPLCLRTLVWPFAVTGCLALPEEETFFLDLIIRMGAMQVFGTVKEALNIMQSVWRLRHGGCVDPETLDIAASLSILGHRALLV